MMWGIWGWLLMIGFCLLLILFIITTVFLVISTYKKTKAGVYGDGDWTIMLVTSIPMLLSILSVYALYYLLIKNPFFG